jgi:hypothetical protein
MVLDTATAALEGLLMLLVGPTPTSEELLDTPRVGAMTGVLTTSDNKKD